MRKLIYLEELMKRPVLIPGRLPAETLVDLHATAPPIPLRLLRRSLDQDVGHPVTRTFLPFPSPHLPKYHHAAELIKSTIMTLRHNPQWKRKGERYVALKSAQFVLEESELMSREIESGDDTRNQKKYLMGQWFEKLKDQADKMEHVERAVKDIQTNADMHPVMKRYIIGQVCRILSRQ